ncbi:MAG: GTP-binding protein [Candidatus Asgardarchaeia archaeon]
MNEKKETYIFKVIIVGDAFVGKTSLAIRFAKKYCSETYILTIGVNVLKRVVEYDNKTVVLDIWDTGGQERFNYIRASYFRGASGAIICYDVTNRKSFENIPKWISEVDQHCEEIPMVLVGTKKDLEDQRQVSAEEGQKLASAYGMTFFETSAKTGENVEKPFITLIGKIFENYEKISS